jgi:hypothetical protein
MANINDFMTSKYLKKADLGPNGKALFTIKGGEFKNVAQENAAPDRKWILFFQETDKGFPLNKTNLVDCATALNSQDTDGWVGKKIVIYHDDNVRFKGERVGGLRVRAPAPGAAAGKAPTPPPPPAEDGPDDEAPF